MGIGSRTAFWYQNGAQGDIPYCSDADELLFRWPVVHFLSIIWTNVNATSIMPKYVITLTYIYVEYNTTRASIQKHGTANVCPW